MGEIKWMLSGVFFLVFVASIFAYIGGFEADQSSAIGFTDDADMVSANASVVGNLTTYTQKVNESSNIFQAETIELTTETPRRGGEFKVLKDGEPDGRDSTLKFIFQTLFGSGKAFVWLFGTITFTLLLSPPTLADSTVPSWENLISSLVPLLTTQQPPS